MNLVIDIGNSRLKAALFQGGRIVARHTMDGDFADVTERWLDGVAGQESGFAGEENLFAGQEMSVGRAIVSTTRGTDCGVTERLRARNIDVVEFDSSIKVPLVNRYAVPESLGRDRLAAAVGAAAKYPGRNLLVVDFGTAITQDIVSEEGEFLGGSISPGLRMRLRALCDYTGSLPLVDAGDCRLCDHERIPNSTRSAIIDGVVTGIELELEGRIARCMAQFPRLATIFTGGDASLFEKRYKNTIFAEPDLVLVGLNTILDYNAH